MGDCDKFNIPSHLITGGKTPEKHFSDEESIIWAIRKSIPIDYRENRRSRRICLPERWDEFFRERFCETTKDVFYEEYIPPRRAKHGIGRLSVDLIENREHRVYLNGLEYLYLLTVVHEPTKCIYPKCRISVLGADGEPREIGDNDIELDAVVRSFFIRYFELKKVNGEGVSFYGS